MADLGIKPADKADAMPDVSEEVRYPSLNLEGEAVGAVKGSHECSPGDLYTATVRLRVKSVSDGDYGPALSFDVLELNDFTPEEGEYEEEEEAAEEESTPPKKKVPRALEYVPPAA